MPLSARDYKSLSNSLSPFKWTKNELCCYRIFRNLQKYKYVAYTQAERYELTLQEPLLISCTC
jgi:hypothetical protein